VYFAAPCPRLSRANRASRLSLSVRFPGSDDDEGGVNESRLLLQHAEVSGEGGMS